MIEIRKWQTHPFAAPTNAEWNAAVEEHNAVVDTINAMSTQQVVKQMDEDFQEVLSRWDTAIGIRGGAPEETIQFTMNELLKMGWIRP